MLHTSGGRQAGNAALAVRFVVIRSLMKFRSIGQQYGNAMNMIHGWIAEATGTLGLNVERLPPNETDDVFRILRDRFADSTSDLPLWETIDDHVSRKRANGWQDVGEYVGDASCLLVTEKDGPEVYRVSSGKDLTNLLTECPGFEFYVTNDDYDFLLCHNHHDYLIGTGGAAEWVATKSDD